MSATVAIASSCAPRMAWINVRSPGGAAVSSRASVSLKRLFSRKIRLTESSDWASSAIDVKCICIASACSICRDQPTRTWAWSRRFVWRAVSVTVRRLTAVIAMKSRVIRRKPASSLTWTEARMRATARTGAPSGEARSAITGDAARSVAAASAMSPARLAGRHLHGHRGRILIADHDIPGDGAEAFLPDLQRVAPGGKATELELAGTVGERVEGMLGDDDPAAHPRVQVARDADDLGVRERDRDRSSLRLRAVEGRIRRRHRVQVVQEAVAVQEVDLSAGRNGHHPGREHALFLVHRGRRRHRLAPGRC